MKVTLIGYTPNPLYVCAEAAAACYDSEPDLKIIKGCIRSGHQSVLEHCSFTFRVEGISRSCSHQIVRHRIASYSQQSQRYVKYDNLDWVIPDYGIDGDYAKHACDIMLNAYKEMTNESDPGFQKSTIDAARCVLPNATPTVIYVTFNLRAFMHFCNERICARASREIHDVANAMVREVLAARQISEEEKKILATVLVPKCEAGQLKACPESAKDCCGRHKPIKEFIWRPKAEWGPSDVPGSMLSKCSHCGFDTAAATFKFCPECGADMRGEKK